MMETKQADAREFTASDVKASAGLSYRQLNDWDSKGALSSRREGKVGWRKFTPREVFALMVCGEIRRQFGVPLESLRWVRSFMLQEGANHFSYAVETIDKYGFAVWLLTDLKETFIMDTDLEMEDLLHLGFLRGASPKGFILIPINPLVNRLLQCHKPPIKLKIHDQIYAKLRAIKSEDMQRTFRQNVRLVRKGAVQFKKTSRHGKPEPRSSATETNRVVGLRQKRPTMNRPRSLRASPLALGVVQSDVRKPRRRIANADVRTMQTTLGR